jgi:DNA repair protein RadC
MAEYKNLSIKQWALEDRPREKLLEKGIAALSDAELLAILIGSGTREQTAVDLAKNILNTVGNDLNELGKLQVDDLKKIKGIGGARAITIIASLELGRRRKLSGVRQKTQITSSQDIYHLFQPIIAELPHEEFWVVFLNRSNKIIEKSRVSMGGVTGTVIDVKIIMKNALQKLASSVILCHNHPSGNHSPSEADKNITHKLAKAGELLDIKVLDHLIITDEKYFSFADEGIL